VSLSLCGSDRPSGHSCLSSVSRLQDGHTLVPKKDSRGLGCGTGNPRSHRRAAHGGGAVFHCGQRLTYVANKVFKGTLSWAFWVPLFVCLSTPIGPLLKATAAWTSDLRH
jgi:hypothetical protein